MSAAWAQVGLIIVLLALSGFFVAAEFALISARRTVVEPLAVTSSRARATLRAMEDVSVMMACSQLGVTVCGVLIGAVGEPAVAHLIQPICRGVGLPESAVRPVALVLALLLVVTAHVALGEMVPKNVALADPEDTAILLAPPLRAMATLLGPIVRGLNRLANTVVRWTGRDARDEISSTFTRDEVAGLVSESRSEGLLDRQEHDLITSALDFDTGTVERVLLPEADVISLSPQVTAAEVEQACARSGFSRFPVRTEEGTFAGYLHIRDVIDIPAAQRDEPIPLSRIRPLPVVLAGSGLRVALDRMRRRGAHLAQVVAAEPRPAAPADDPAAQLGALVTAASQPPVQARLGLVTLEDVIEELIGEVRDATRRRPPSPPLASDLAPRRGGDVRGSRRRQA